MQGRQSGLRSRQAGLHTVPEPIAAGRVRLPRLTVQEDEAPTGEDDYSDEAGAVEVCRSRALLSHWKPNSPFRGVSEGCSGGDQENMLFRVWLT